MWELKDKEQEILQSESGTRAYRMNTDFILADKRDPNFTPLQAADFLAWELRKWSVDTAEPYLQREKYRPIRTSLGRIYDSGRLMLSNFNSKELLLRLAEDNRRGLEKLNPTGDER